MTNKKNIFALIGSASAASANQRLVETIARLTQTDFNFTIYNELKTLPHFDPQQSADNPPAAVVALRKEIDQAEGVLICTPEYVFSLPSGLKNAIEWCVATAVFSNKPVGLITASAHGQQGHDELQRIMKTLMATFTEETTLLIHGIRGKVDADGAIKDPQTKDALLRFIDAFKKALNTAHH